MLGGIAGQGGFDSKGKTIQYAFATSASTSWVSLLSVSGKGYLTALTLATDNTTYGVIRVTIDGVVKYSAGTTPYSGIGVNPLLRFESSILVEHVSGGGNGAKSSACILLD